MSTLIEELGQAAERVDQLCRDSHPNRDKPCWHAAEASQYRARIAHIRELDPPTFTEFLDGGRRDLYAALVGPIPSTEEPTTEEPKPPQTTCSHGIRFNLRCYACEPG